jgi:hypothetical protein
MLTFELTYETKVLNQEQISVRIFPNNSLISDLICSYATISINDDLLSFVADLISEMTPILFNDFQQMENINNELKSQFVL